MQALWSLQVITLSSTTGIRFTVQMAGRCHRKNPTKSPNMLVQQRIFLLSSLWTSMCYAPKSWCNRLVKMLMKLTMLKWPRSPSTMIWLTKSARTCRWFIAHCTGLDGFQRKWFCVMLVSKTSGWYLSKVLLIQNLQLPHSRTQSSLKSLICQLH